MTSAAPLTTWLAFGGLCFSLSEFAVSAPMNSPAVGIALRTPTAKKSGASVYASRCAVCHGERGAGDGPGAKFAKPAPPDFRSPQWQAGISDAKLRVWIVKGGAALGRSAAMPAAPDLADTPELTALVSTLRGFGKAGFGKANGSEKPGK